MKKILTTFLLLLAIVNLSAKSNEVVTLTCSGSAKTEAEAINIALRSAIEQTYGAFISSNTNIINDKLVKDEIVSISNGNIQGYDKIAVINHPNGSINVTLRATVSINKLVDFAVSNGATVNFDGSTYAANVKMAKLRQENTFKAFSNMCDQVEEMCPRAFDWHIRMETPKAYSNNVTVTVELIPNAVTVEIYQLINRTIRSLALSESDIQLYNTMGIRTFCYHNPDIYKYEKAKRGGHWQRVEVSENPIILPISNDVRYDERQFYKRQQNMFDSIIESMKNYTISEIHTDPSIVREHNLNLHALQIDMTIVEGPSETHRVYRLEDIFDKDAFKIVNWKDWDNNNKIIDTQSIDYEYSSEALGDTFEYLYEHGMSRYELEEIMEETASVGSTLSYLERFHYDAFSFLYRKYVPAKTKNSKKTTGDWSKKVETLLKYIPTKGVTLYTWTHSIPAEIVKNDTFRGFKIERKNTEFKKEADETDIDNDIFDFLGI